MLHQSDLAVFAAARQGMMPATRLFRHESEFVDAQGLQTRYYFMGLKRLPTREFQRCVTTAFKTLGLGLQRSTTNSLQVISVPAHVGSPPQKMPQSRCVFFRELSLRFPVR
jgi:hypothetical protein